MQPREAFDRLHLHAQQVSTWDPVSSEVLHRLLTQHERGFMALLEAPPVRRLAGIKQMGIKLIGGRRPSEHNRLVHSLHDGAYAGIIAQRLLATEKEVHTILLGGLLHDLGHCSFAHDGERALLMMFDWCHEIAGKQIIRTNKQILHALELMEIDPEPVIEVISENGFLGAIQQITDTSVYTHDDGRLAGCEDTDLMRRIAESLIGIDSQHAFQVNDTGPLQELLDLRAYLGAEVYHEHGNQLTQKAFFHLLFLAIDVGLITIDMLEHGVDDEIQTILDDTYRNHKEPRIRSIYAMMQGDVESQLQYWEVTEYPDGVTGGGRDGTLRYCRGDLEKYIGRKSIPVVVNGRSQTLLAHGTIAEPTRHTEVFTWNG